MHSTEKWGTQFLHLWGTAPPHPQNTDEHPHASKEMTVFSISYTQINNRYFGIGYLIVFVYVQISYCFSFWKKKRIT